MRVVVQRVKRAALRIEGQMHAEIEEGLVLLIGIGRGDTDEDAEYVAGKCAGLRIFGDESGKMSYTVSDVGGEILAISQFTLCGDTRKGKRPSFTEAARPEHAEPLYERFLAVLRGHGLDVRTGVFGAHMVVEILNDGPVTLIVEGRPIQ
ncbi:MAG: D-aminoacyl-tRNA deacylase [Candidatus Latescibacterota bacterium]